MLQIDGINFIEHLDCNVFNKGPGCKAVFICSENFLGNALILSAHQIYATNANRKYYTKNNFSSTNRRGSRYDKIYMQRRCNLER